MLYFSKYAKYNSNGVYIVHTDSSKYMANAFANIRDKEEKNKFVTCDYCLIVNTIRKIIHKYGILPTPQESHKTQQLFSCFFCEKSPIPQICNKTLKEFCDIMKYLIKAEYNVHSSIWPYFSKDTEKSRHNAPELKILCDHILYIKINSFSFHENTTIDILLIPAVKRLIKKCDDFCLNNSYNSIIIDVRGNTGGNAAVMCRFLKHVYESASDKHTCRLWMLKNPLRNIYKYAIHASHSGGGEGGMKYVSECIYKQTPPYDGLPICVLINRGTQSAGEFCVAPFVGTKKATFLGENSGGLLTDNEFYFINNNKKKQYTISVLPTRKTKITVNLTNGIIFRHDGKPFVNDTIEPDIKTIQPLNDAIKLLNSLTNKKLN